MRSDHTLSLFDKLGHIAQDVEQALSADDFPAIESLIAAHLDIMSELSSSKTPVNVDMKPAIEQADKNVRELITKIQSMQSDIRKQLSTMGNKKRIHSAYNV